MVDVQSRESVTDFATNDDFQRRDCIEKEDTQISGKLLLDITKQILEPLSILKCKKYGFVHGDLKCQNIFVKKGSTGAIIFKLADFDKSSIFWKGIRFHTTSDLKVVHTLLSPPCNNK